MKKKCISFNLELLFVTFLLISFSGFAQEKAIVWNFPIEAHTYEEYNIPEEIIKTISTFELVKTCLAYPQWGLMNAYNSRVIGLNNMLAKFNGFQELFLRDDASYELVNVYIGMNPLDINENWSSLQKGKYCSNFTCIEMLLSHPTILNKLTKPDLQKLLNEAVIKFRTKQQRPDFYSLWNLSPTVGLCLNILKTNHEISLITDSTLQRFQQTFFSEDIETLNRIIEISEKTKL